MPSQCFDFGAFGKLKAIAQTEDGLMLEAHVEGHPDQVFLTIPADQNDNQVADVWEREVRVFDQNLGPKWNGTLDPKYAGQAIEGDGISLYEKYRGFFVLSNGVQRVYERLDPRLKYVFVRNPDRLVSQIFQSADGAPESYPTASRCEVRYIADGGWTGFGTFAAGKRVVNFNCADDRHAIDQHALYVVVDTAPNPHQPDEWIELMNRLGGKKVAKPIDASNEGASYPDDTGPAEVADHWRPARVYEVVAFAASVTNYVYDCVRHHSSSLTGGLTPAQKEALLANHISASFPSYQQKYAIELSATITHEMGHGTGVNHHDPDDSSATDLDLANCTMRYYSPTEFPANVADRFELAARGHQPASFCRKVFDWWGQLQVNDDPAAGKEAASAPAAALLALRPLALHAPVAATIDPGPLEIAADLAWNEVVAGDPLRVWVRLHGPTSLVAPNWIDGVRLTLSRRTSTGQRETVLGPEGWRAWLQPSGFDTRALPLPDVSRSREWLASPAAAGLTPGTYTLEVAWDGHGLAPTDQLPVGGTLSGGTVEFEVHAAAGAALQALHQRHLAWHSHAAGDDTATLEHGWEADRLDPEATDSVAMAVRFMSASSALRQTNAFDAAQLMQDLSRRLPGSSDHTAILARERLGQLAPVLSVIEPVAELQPVRLQLEGLPGSTYVLERSTDLRKWAPFATNTLAANRLILSDTVRLLQRRKEWMMHDTDHPKGPISRKVLTALDKELRPKVIDFEAIRLGEQRAEELERGVISEKDMRDRDPLHAVYSYAQNKLSVLVEDLAELPMCTPLADAYSAAAEEYLPSGPPMSPLAMSYSGGYGLAGV